MKVYINVRIEQEPGDATEYGFGQSIQFGETAAFEKAGFETVSKVFTRCHELLDVLRQEHAATKRK